MNFINTILKAFVGDKSQRDIKSLEPIVKKIRSYEEAFSSLSNDELRAKTVYFKEKIKESRAEKDSKIASYREEIEKTQDIDRKEAIEYAINMATKADIIVLSGKGHETYQEINGKKYHLDEREIINEIKK